MTSAPAEPAVIDGGDRACIALLLGLRDRISDLAAGTVIHLIASDTRRRARPEAPGARQMPWPSLRQAIRHRGG